MCLRRRLCAGLRGIDTQKIAETQGFHAVVPLERRGKPVSTDCLPTLKNGRRLPIAPNSWLRVPGCGQGRRSLGRPGIREGGHRMDRSSVARKQDGHETACECPNGFVGSSCSLTVLFAVPGAISVRFWAVRLTTFPSRELCSSFGDSMGRRSLVQLWMSNRKTEMLTLLWDVTPCR